jgi:hypothetical protein
MLSRASMLSVFTLSTATFFGMAAMAADLPKEGTYEFNYAAFGTIKPTPVGKDLVLLAFDENGLSVGNGLFDHMTWHCWGLADITNGTVQHRGYCVATDPSGDQVASTIASDDRYPQNAKNIRGILTLMSGTGKYAGISGGHKYVANGSEFRPATEGTYFQYTTNQGSYKLP